MTKEKWKPGDRVRVVTREVNREDRQTALYFHHMAGLTGTVTSYYGIDEVAVKVDPDAFTSVLETTHKEAVKRMRAKFLDSLGEEQKRRLTKEEKQFSANQVILVHADDLENGPAPVKIAAVVEEDDEEELDTFDPTSVRQDVLYDDAEVPQDNRRTTVADIDAREQAELERRKN
ncbi:MAG: hypothetical protein ABIV13_05885 [Fimbriimonadales bacterium]